MIKTMLLAAIAATGVKARIRRPALWVARPDILTADGDDGTLMRFRRAGAL